MVRSGKQQGMTLIGWLLMMALIGFFAILFLKLWPIYYENFAVKRAVAKLPSQADIYNKTNDQIWNIIERQFIIDQVRSTGRKDLKVERQDDGSRQVSMKYEVRVHVMFNVDVVVYFDDKVTLPQK